MISPRVWPTGYTLQLKHCHRLIVTGVNSYFRVIGSTGPHCAFPLQAPAVGRIAAFCDYHLLCQQSSLYLITLSLTNTFSNYLPAATLTQWTRRNWRTRFKVTET